LHNYLSNAPGIMGFWSFTDYSLIGIGGKKYEK